MTAKSVLITGANRGIGLEFVKQFLGLEIPPKHLFAACRNPTKAEELNSLAKENPALCVMKLDMQNMDETLEDMVTQIQQLTGDDGLNMLLNNAAYNKKQVSLEDQTREDLMDHFEVNSVAPLMLTQRLLPLLRKAADSLPQSGLSCSRAAVLNISTQMSSLQQNSGKYYAYRSSKAALNMLTSCQSKDLAPLGILSVCVHPGWVSTDMGGAKAPVTPTQSVAGILQVMATLTHKDNGALMDYNGQPIPW